MKIKVLVSMCLVFSTLTAASSSPLWADPVSPEPSKKQTEVQNPLNPAAEKANADAVAARNQINVMAAQPMAAAEAPKPKVVQRTVRDQQGRITLEENYTVNPDGSMQGFIRSYAYDASGNLRQQMEENFMGFSSVEITKDYTSTASSTKIVTTRKMKTWDGKGNVKVETLDVTTRETAYFPPGFGEEPKQRLQKETTEIVRGDGSKEWYGLEYWDGRPGEQKIRYRGRQVVYALEPGSKVQDYEEGSVEYDTTGEPIEIKRTYAVKDHGPGWVWQRSWKKGFDSWDREKVKAFQMEVEAFIEAGRKGPWV